MFGREKSERGKKMVKGKWERKWKKKGKKKWGYGKKNARERKSGWKKITHGSHNFSFLQIKEKKITL